MVLLLEPFCCLPLAGSVEGLIASLWSNGESPTRGSCLCLSTRLPMGTGATVLRGEFDLDDRVATPIKESMVKEADLSSRTDALDS